MKLINNQMKNTNDSLDKMNIWNSQNQNISNGRLNLYEKIKKSSFRFENKEYFVIYESAVDLYGTDKQKLCDSKMQEFQNLIQNCKKLITVVRYLFKNILNLDFDISWIPKNFPKNKFSFYDLQLRSKLFDSKNQFCSKYLNKKIIKVRLFSKGIKFAIESVSWKIVELFFPLYLNLIINSYPIEKFYKLLNPFPLDTQSHKLFKPFGNDPATKNNSMNQIPFSYSGNLMQYPVHSNIPFSNNQPWNGYMHPNGVHHYNFQPHQLNSNFGLKKGENHFIQNPEKFLNHETSNQSIQILICFDLYIF
jgi:hypothetical protein